MPKPVSREYRIYLAIWRKAVNSEEEITIRASTFNLAIAMRQGMYRAIRPYRSGEIFDAELSKAADLFVVQIEKLPDPSAPHILRLKPRLTLNELEAELANLGLDEADLLLGEERAVEAKLAEFLEPTEVEEDVEFRPIPRDTPFYSRS